MSDLRLATFEDDHFHLVNAEGVHRKHPDTFWLPTRRVRESLEPGMEVKVMFDLGDGDVERMWVAVTERLGGRYLGMLRNQPFAYDPDDEDVYLRWGAEVAFAPEHVIDVNDDDPVDEAARTAFTRRWTR